jgi:hypothetical protein
MVARGRIGKASIRPAELWPWVRSWTLWTDRWACGMAAAALLVNLGMFAYVYLAYGSLPPLIPLHYNASNAVDLIGEPEQLFKLPAIAAVVFGADLLLSAAAHRAERLAALMLLGGCLFVEVLLFAATVNIVFAASGSALWTA